MNWLFEAYSNVYNTAMGQRTFHHYRRDPRLNPQQGLPRTKVKNDV